MYTNMMIVESISEESARDVRNLMDAHVADLTEGFLGSQRLSEEGGSMVILETMWADKRSHLAYLRSYSYRHLVSAIRPYLVGDPVHKTFLRYSYTEEFAGIEGGA